MTRNLRRGDVVWIAVPRGDLSGFKRRPCILVTPVSTAERLGSALVVPISSRVDLEGPARILVSKASAEGREMALRMDSRVFVDELVGVPYAFLGERIGTCPLMAEIDRLLRELVAVP